MIAGYLLAFSLSGIAVVLTWSAWVGVMGW